MHTFRVWAPNAKSVNLEIAGESRTMSRDDNDWWSLEVESAGPGTDYKFSINGGNPIPDPRSEYQPEGINGPSRVLDHATFAWTDTRWQARPLSSAILYELHIGTFTPEGTFRSAIGKLDYLVDLGITHVELMPVNEFSGQWGWGYDGADLYAPHHSYGTPDDLKALVDACHAKGLAAILDVVYNHLGPAGNYLNHFGPYFTGAYHTPWGPAVNLDHKGSHEVRRFFANNALMWLRHYHFDGLRLDAVHAFFDKSATHFLEFLAEEVSILSSQLGRHLVLIAESDLNDPRVVSSRDCGGLGISAQWNDDFHHALHSVLTRETKGYYEDFGTYWHLAKALREVFVYDGYFSPHRGRIHGRPAGGLFGHKFLAYSQNHDQVGNRAQGERLSQMLSPGKQKIAAALVLTSPFVPMLFEGEEFASSSPFLYFTHHDDPALGQAVSEGRRNEFKAFGWSPEEVPDPQDPTTFEKSKLRWDEIAQEPHRSIFNWYKRLIALRRSTRWLVDGRLDLVDTDYDEQAGWFVLHRGPVQVLCNFSTDRQAIPLDCKHDEFICSEEGWSLRPGMIELPAESVAIATSN